MYYELYASSHTSTSGDLSRPTWLLNETVDRFKIMRMQIPMSFHSVNASNNTLLFSSSANDPAATKQAILPPSDYNITNIEEALATALNKTSSQTYKVTYDLDTKQLTITAPQPFRILGTSEGTTTSWLGVGTSMPGLGTSVTFPNLADFTVGTSILLVSRALEARNAKWLGNLNMNVLGLIDCSAPGSVLNWENSSGGWLYAPGGAANFISELDLALLDSKTLKPINITTPFTLTLGILTDPEDPEP